MDAKKTTKTGQWRLTVLAPLIDPNLHTTIALTLIGVLLILNLMLRFPNLGEVIEEFHQF